MASKARDIKESTIKRLFMLSGNECAETTCIKTLIARDGISLISKICHIEAAEPGGARYRDAMTDDERRGFDNLILLCDECHTIIDNPANEKTYTVPLLKYWKKTHEAKMLTKFTLNPSLLKNIINEISKLSLENAPIVDTQSLVPFSIDEKIAYNSITRNKFLIDEYKVYYSKINALYTELEKQGSFRKEDLLRYIRQSYLAIKGKYVGDSKNVDEIIRENSDNIIEEMQNVLVQSIIKDETTYQENIEFGIAVVMVDAFIRCKILEEPK
jgi:hypothetical protein